MFVGIEDPLELLSVEYEELIDVGGYQFLQLDILLPDPLAQPVEQKFLHRLAVQVASGDHL